VIVTVPVEMPQGVSYEGVFGKVEACTTGGLRKLGVAGKAARVAHWGAESSRGSGMILGLQADTSGAVNSSGLRFCYDASANEEPAKPERLTLADRRRRGLAVKLPRDLWDLPQVVGTKRDYERGRVLVKDGRVELAVYLTEYSQEVVAKLKALGFELLRESKVTKGMVIGRIAVEKLEALALLEVVVHIEPTRWSEME
jgi:hypothetical protein